MRAKKLLSLLLVLVFVVGLLPVAAYAANFSDTDGHWAEAAIDRWSGYGVVNGVGDGKFDPDGTMTRAQAAQVFTKLMGLTSTTGAMTFSDVPANAWYADAVAKVTAAGIMNGVGDGLMNPEGYVTREQFFVMFARAIGLKEQSTTSGPRADGSSWSAGYINALTDRGYVKGDGNGVNALANINRASVMSLLDQTIKQYVNTSGSTTLNATDGIVLVAAKDVALTGTTAADIVIAQGADNGTVAFEKATVTGAIIAQAANATITSDKDSAITTPTINGANTTYTPATTAAVGGGGNSGNSVETVDPGALTQIASADDVTAEKMASYTNVTGSGTTEDPYIVTGDVTITDALADGNLTLQNTQFTGNLTVAGGGSNSITLENVSVTDKLIFNKTSGEMPHVKATGTTSVGLGVEVASGSTGAKLSVDGSATNKNAFKAVLDAKADVLVTGSATLDKVTVSAGGVSVKADGNDATISAVDVTATSGAVDIESQTAITEISTKTDVSITSNATVGTVTSSGTSVTIAVEKGTVSNVVAESGTTTISATSGTVNAVEAQAAVTLQTDVVTVTVPDTKASGAAVTGVNIVVDKGAKINTASVGANGATISAGTSGGSVGTVSTSGSVALTSVPVATVTVNEDAAATITLSGSTEIATLNAAGNTTIAASNSTGTVGTLNAKGGDVTVSGGTVEKISVSEDNSTATTITVSGGEVAEVEAKSQTTVTGTSGTVGNVTASAEGCSVNAAVVEQVTVNASTGSTLTIDNATGTNKIEIDAGNSSALNIVSTGSIENGNISAKSATGSAGTISVAKSDGTVSTVTVKTKSTAPSKIEYNSRTSVEVTLGGSDSSASTGTVKLYDAGGKQIGNGVTPSNGQATFTVANTVTKVYATYQATGDDKAESDKSAAATFAPLSIAYTTALDVESGDISTSYTGSTALTVTGTNASKVTWSDSSSWLSVGNDNKLTGTRPATAAVATTVRVTATATDDSTDTTYIDIPVGAVTLPLSTALKSVAFDSSDYSYKTITVTAGDSATFDSADTFTVYAGNATTAKTIATSSVVKSGDSKTVTITLSSSPAADVYVLYTAANHRPAESLVGTSSYKAFALTESGKTGVSDVELNLKSEDKKTFSEIDFSTFIEGGASTDATKANTYKYSISGAPSWMSFDADTGKLTGTNPAATDTTKVTVTVTDGAGQSFRFPFNVTVNDDTVYVTSVTVSGAKTQLVAGETLQLSTAVTPARADNKTVAWSISENSVNATVENGVVKIGASTVSADTTVTVTATANGAASGATVTGTYTITVKKDAYTVSVTGGATAITSGSEAQTVPFTAVVKNNGVTANNTGVKWTVAPTSTYSGTLDSNLKIDETTGVLTIPADLKVIGGSVALTVTATYGETTGTARITVTRAAVAAPDATLFTGKAPSTYNGNDGYIANAEGQSATAALEYATGANGSFSDLTLGSDGTKLAAGTYYVRYAETTDGAAPSAAVAVKVPAYKASITATVDNPVLVIPTDSTSATAKVTAKVVENDEENSSAAVTLTAKYGTTTIPAEADSSILSGGVTFSDGTLSVTSAAKNELTSKGVNTIAVIVTATYTSSGTTKSYSAVVAITLNGEISGAPTWTTGESLTDASYYKNTSTVAELQLTVTPKTASDTLDIKWYKTDTLEGESGSEKPVGGAEVTSETTKPTTDGTATYTTKVTPDVTESGVWYYYAVASETGKSSDETQVDLPSTSVQSTAYAKITVIDITADAAKVIPATLHDTTTGSEAIADDKLYDADSYTANGTVDAAAEGNVVNVAVSAKNLAMHDSNGAGRAYWVGVGIPQVKGVDGSALSVSYATGWSESELNESASADSHMTEDGVTYDTFYFGTLSSFTGKTGYIKATYTIGEPSNTVVVLFVLDFSGVTLVEKDSSYTVTVTYTEGATGTENKTITATGSDGNPAAITGLKVGDVTTKVEVTGGKDSALYKKVAGASGGLTAYSVITVGDQPYCTPYGTVKLENGKITVTIAGSDNGINGAGGAGYAGKATIFLPKSAESAPANIASGDTILATVTVDEAAAAELTYEVRYKPMTGAEEKTVKANTITDMKVGGSTTSIKVTANAAGTTVPVYTGTAFEQVLVSKLTTVGAKVALVGSDGKVAYPEFGALSVDGATATIDLAEHYGEAGAAGTFYFILYTGTLQKDNEITVGNSALFTLTVTDDSNYTVTVTAKASGADDAEAVEVSVAKSASTGLAEATGLSVGNVTKKIEITDGTSDPLYAKLIATNAYIYASYKASASQNAIITPFGEVEKEADGELTITPEGEAGRAGYPGTATLFIGTKGTTPASMDDNAKLVVITIGAATATLTYEVKYIKAGETEETTSTANSLTLTQGDKTNNITITANEAGATVPVYTDSKFEQKSVYDLSDAKVAIVGSDGKVAYPQFGTLTVNGRTATIALADHYGDAGAVGMFRFILTTASLSAGTEITGIDAANVLFTLTVNETTLDSVLNTNGVEEVTLSKSEETYIATTKAGFRYTGLTIGNTVEIPAGVKLTVADAGTYSALTSSTLTVNANGELFVGEQAIIQKADASATYDKTSGTILTTGQVEIRPTQTDPTVTFKSGAVATIYGWAENWKAIAENNAEINFATQTIAGATLTYINAEIAGGAKITIGSGTDKYEILGTASEPTNGNYLTVPNGAKVTLGEGTLTIAEGTVTIPEGKEWITAWNDGADSIYKVAIAQGATLEVNGTMRVLGNITNGGTVKIGAQGVVTLNSVELLQNSTGSLEVTAGGSITVGETPIFFHKTSATAANQQGTYLEAGKATVDFSKNTVTFDGTAQAMIYGWDKNYTAQLSSGALILFADQSTAAKTLDYVTANIASGAKIGIGTFGNYYLIVGVDNDTETNGRAGDHFLSLTGNASSGSYAARIENKTLTITGTANVPTGKKWTTAWDGSHPYSVAVSGRLTIDGDMTVVSTGTISIDNSGTITLGTEGTLTTTVTGLNVTNSKYDSANGKYSYENGGNGAASQGGSGSGNS